MPITPLNPTLASPQSPLSTGLDKSGNPLLRTPGAAAPQRSAPAAATEPGAASADTVSISSSATALETQDLQVPVYAEIWKDGIKVAQIDIHGQVTSYSGLLASGGSALAGPLLAAQRAVQVAQQTGGEIRTAGQILDGQTLLMRARLANTYTP